MKLLILIFSILLISKIFGQEQDSNCRCCQSDEEGSDTSCVVKCDPQKCSENSSTDYIESKSSNSEREEVFEVIETRRRSWSLAPRMIEVDAPDRRYPCKRGYRLVGKICRKIEQLA
jgi:hypothetical protein